MIEVCILLSLVGIGMILYGVWEYKHIYNDQHFADAEVVEFEPYRSRHLAMAAMAAVGGMMIPVIQMKMETGEIRRVKLENVTVMKGQLSSMPELDIGGCVQVTYFGKNPKKAYLTNHQLAQTQMKFSPALVIGIAIALIGIGMLAYTIYYYYFT